MSANHLFDHVIKKMHLKNDAALSRFLGKQSPGISKMRHGRQQVGPTVILEIHDRCDIPVKTIRDLIALDE